MTKKVDQMYEIMLEKYPELKARGNGMPFVRQRNGEFSTSLKKVEEGVNVLGELLKNWKPGDYNFTNGNPIERKGFPPCLEAMKKALEDPMQMARYPYTEGADSIRQNVLGYITKEGFFNDQPYETKDLNEVGLSQNNIVFCDSTSSGVNYVIDAISNPGDVIIVTSGNYGLFGLRVEWNNAKVTILPVYKEERFLINPERLNQLIKSENERLAPQGNKVAALFISNPNNPLGTVMTVREKELMEEILEVCIKNQVFIIDDQIYRDIVFNEEDKPLAFSNLKGGFKVSITMMGLSKSYCLPALRAGVVVADEMIIQHIINNIFRTNDSPSHLNAVAIGAAFNATKERDIAYKKYFGEIRKAYVENFKVVEAMVNGFDNVEESTKDEVIEVLEQNGMTDFEIASVASGIKGVEIMWKPQAGFFALLDVTCCKDKSYDGIKITNERELLEYMYKNYKVRYLYGGSILWQEEDRFVARISFAKDKGQLICGLYALKCGVENLV